MGCSDSKDATNVRDTTRTTSDKAPSSKYKLTYFPARARAEHIRMIFAAAGIPFDDITISREEWPELKPKTPMGFLPILDVNGKVLSQSNSIARFVAGQGNLLGDNNADKAQADAIVDTALELREDGIIPMVSEKDPEAKTAKIDKFKKETLPLRLQQLQNLLGDNNYFVANKLSWADVVVFCVLEQVGNCHKDFEECVDNYEAIRKHYNRMAANPGIAKYIQNRTHQVFLKLQ